MITSPIYVKIQNASRDTKMRILFTTIMTAAILVWLICLDQVIRIHAESNSQQTSGTVSGAAQ